MINRNDVCLYSPQAGVFGTGGTFLGSSGWTVCPKAEGARRLGQERSP